MGPSTEQDITVRQYTGSATTIYSHYRGGLQREFDLNRASLPASVDRLRGITSAD